MSAKSQPVIVIKKKGGHGGHHGGAWKVAYADFVTAMMSLFIVLWLMSQSQNVRKAVAGYFNDPKGTASLLGTTMSGNGEATITQDDANKRKLEELKQKLEKEIQARKELEKLSKQIEITITPEGLRIELLEGKNGTFYQLGSAQLSDNGQELLALLASELKTLPNKLLIEGHTDAARYVKNTDYSNWELSADRANSARRLLQEDGVRSDQVTQVRAYADQMLRVPGNPFDPSNRRITILVKNGDGSSPPTSYRGGIVDGGPPGALPASAAAGKAAAQPAAKPAAAALTPGKAPSAAAKSGLMGRVAGWIPGKKK
jgi:chemotaxis protein MotB